MSSFLDEFYVLDKLLIVLSLFIFEMELTEIGRFNILLMFNDKSLIWCWSVKIILCFRGHLVVFWAEPVCIREISKFLTCNASNWNVFDPPAGNFQNFKWYLKKSPPFQTFVWFWAEILDLPRSPLKSGRTLWTKHLQYPAKCPINLFLDRFVLLQISFNVPIIRKRIFMISPWTANINVIDWEPLKNLFGIKTEHHFVLKYSVKVNMDWGNDVIF